MTALCAGSVCAHDLPKCIQNLPDEKYQAWAYWQNAQAAAAAEGYSYEPRRLHADKTVVQRSGGAASTGSTSGLSRSFKGVTTRHGSASRNTRAWGATTAYTVPYSYQNPYYEPQSVTVYNPFVKPPVTGVAPDWDSLYLYINGEVKSVTEALADSAVPMHPEDLYAWFVRNTMGSY
ncbi:MAG: hypothetical protein AMS22_06330 [Thiotrichales bacterium SG8_50]|nr:MAG: hypothetical protein AMS22_06330 [Thiotrichales bacterium SG8_50]